MELPKFEELWEIVRQFGVIGKVNFTLHDLETDGIEIQDLKDVIKAPGGLYRVLDDGTIVKIILYISDREERLIKHKFGFPKFHLFDCCTLQSMQAKGRSHRYKISCRKDGKFRFIILEKYNKARFIPEQELEVCGFCLNMFNSFFALNALKSDFVSKGFLKKFLSCDLPIGIAPNGYELDYETVPNVYSKDWAIIAKRVKAARNYTCEKCKWAAPESERLFIHAHHIDGKKFNSKYDNIKILCIYCHSEEPGHEHIKNTENYKAFKTKYCFRECG